MSRCQTANTVRLPSHHTVEACFREIHGEIDNHQGWQIRMSHAFGCFHPNLSYEALVDSLVAFDTTWLDVGCGTSPFPHNPKLAGSLSRRCACFVGVDPTDHVNHNPYVHTGVQCGVEDFATDERFDLITMRMVAEHIENPKRAVASLSKHLRVGGYIVIYTPNRWSPLSIAASVIPNRMHHVFAGFLWNAKSEDVFPTVYRMNTRHVLQQLFDATGCREAAFKHVDACPVLAKWQLTCWIEMVIWSLVHKCGISYPENNLLAVYEKC